MADETATGVSVYKVRVTAAQLRHFPQLRHCHLADAEPWIPGPLLKIFVASKITPKSHFEKIVLKDRVSVRVKIIIGFPEIRKTKRSKKQPTFIFIRQRAGCNRKERGRERVKQRKSKN